MTIVIFIPFNKGCILLADRQDSYDDGKKIEITKIHLLNKKGPAIGCSGPSSIIRKFISDLTVFQPTAKVSVQEQIATVLEKVFRQFEKNALYSKDGLKPQDLLLEWFLIEIADGKTVLSKFDSLVSLSLDPSKIAIIPPLPGTEKYLDIQTKQFSEKKALFLGEQILRQMSFTCHTIGPPEYHGYDVIKIFTEGVFQFESKSRSLERMDVSQLLAYVNMKMGD